MLSTLGVITGVLGAVIFLFFFWKKLKEDYVSDQIFGSGLFILLGIVSGGTIFFYLGSRLPASGVFRPEGLWFWGAVLGLGVSLSLALYKFKLRTLETLEAAGISLLPWLSLIFLADAITHSRIVSLLASLLVLGLVALYFFLKSKFGKVGYSGLAVLGGFFLARAVVAIISPVVLSFVGRVEGIVSAIAAFGFFFALYYLTEKEK